MRDKINKIPELGKRAARSKSFRRYIFVGATTVILDIALLVVLREKFKGGLFSAVTIAYWSSILYNFFLNRNWSFEANNGMVPRQALQYGILLLCNYLITILIVTQLEFLGVNEYLAKMVALSITISWTYIVYKKIIFKAE